MFGRSVVQPVLPRPAAALCSPSTHPSRQADDEWGESRVPASRWSASVDQGCPPGCRSRHMAARWRMAAISDPWSSRRSSPPRVP